MKFKDGTKFTGTWKNNIMVAGEFFWENGDKYEGEVRKGKITGRGKFIPANKENGNHYEGQWLNGHFHGNGRLLLVERFRAQQRGPGRAVPGPCPMARARGKAARKALVAGQVATDLPVQHCPTRGRSNCKGPLPAEVLIVDRPR